MVLLGWGLPRKGVVFKKKVPSLKAWEQENKTLGGDILCGQK